LEVEEVEDDATIPSNYVLYGGKNPQRNKRREQSANPHTVKFIKKMCRSL